MMFSETRNLKKIKKAFAVYVHYLSISIDFFERRQNTSRSSYVPGCTRYLSIRLDTPSVSRKVRFCIHTCFVSLEILQFNR